LEIAHQTQETILSRHRTISSAAVIRAGAAMDRLEERQLISAARKQARTRRPAAAAHQTSILALFV